MSMRTQASVSILVVLWLCLAPSAAAEPPRIAKGTADLWPADAIRWEPMPGLPGARQAPLWGDPTRGEHGILYRWPAGTSVPVHTHSNGDHGVVLSGTMTLAIEGRTLEELPPGSYFSLGGGVKHATACSPGKDCVFFIHREGAFDAHMVEAGGKPAR